MFVCEFCKKEFNSQESLGGHRSGHVRRGEIAKRVEREKLFCELCNERFASAAQLGSHRRFIHNPRPLDGLCSRAKKTHLLHRLGHQCQVCLLSEWMSKPIPIELDHIDGNPENEVRENLRLICPNCHAQTDTYKGKNMGKVQNSKRAGVLKKYVGKYR